ncbi:MAG TPA: MoaD/ThiS family protein [Gemmatimonadota bacterium]|nr:MoaD/ThiS family protein [Gemmatimonadota bacterium]
MAVRLFGPAREAAGSERVAVEVPGGATAADVVSALEARYPALAGLLPRSRVAVNLEYVDGDTRLGPGDEVAILPPVGGG